MTDFESRPTKLGEFRSCSQRHATGTVHWHPLRMATGSPRGVTPALDVERLAKALEAADRQVMTEGELAGSAAYRDMARQVAAEYARLGSPE